MYKLLTASFFVAFIALWDIIGVIRAHNHMHMHQDHGHSHEGHGHSHEGHGHSHEGHGHSHDGHGHAHDHFHDIHDHSHDFHGHDHLHDHMDEPVHFKYSREANEPHVRAPPAKTNANVDKGSKFQEPKIAKKTVTEASPLLYDENGLFWFLNDATYRLWIYSLGSTLLISAAPFFILFLIPISGGQSAKDSPFLKVLLSFASGGLLGDALLHLIPHALSAKEGHGHSHHGHSHVHGDGRPTNGNDHFHDRAFGDDHVASDIGHGHSHEHGHDMTVGLFVLLGITTFLIIEKGVRIAKGGEGGDGHGHGHSHAIVLPKKAAKKATKEPRKKEHSNGDGDLDEQKDDHSEQHQRADDSDSADVSPKNKNKKDNSELRRRRKSSAISDASTGSATKNADALKSRSNRRHSERSSSELDNHDHDLPQSDIKVAGYLNLAADFAHNFTDGLAVGASFIAGNAVGVITTLTVLVHEVPHEIGDFAILIQSGCSKKNAIFLQLLTALGAVLGCCISLCTTDAEAIAHAAESSWVLPFTAGGFIYVATVSVIPELLENSGFWQSVKEILALLVGIALMVLIAKFE